MPLKFSKRFIALFLCAFLAVGIFACRESSKRIANSPMQTVRSVDLERYLGKWYEIARFPFSVQDGCVATTATYKKLDDDKIDVLNECRMQTFYGPENTAHGKAWIVDSATNAKLKVSFNFFMGLFGGGDYWIIRLADDYSYAVVSEPKGRYLWILSRTPRMNQATYRSIVEDLKSDGFLVEHLIKTPQPE